MIKSLPNIHLASLYSQSIQPVYAGKLQAKPGYTYIYTGVTSLYQPAPNQFTNLSRRIDEIRVYLLALIKQKLFRSLVMTSDGVREVSDAGSGQARVAVEISGVRGVW